MPCPRPARCRQAPGRRHQCGHAEIWGRPSPGARILPPGSPPPLAGQGAPGLPLGRQQTTVGPRRPRASGTATSCSNRPHRGTRSPWRALATRRRGSAISRTTVAVSFGCLQRCIRMIAASRCVPAQAATMRGSQDLGPVASWASSSPTQGRPDSPMRGARTSASATLTRQRATARVHPVSGPRSARKMTYHRNSGQ